MKLTVFLLLTSVFAAGQCVNLCNVCKMTVSAMATWYKTNGPTDDDAFLKALLNQCNQLSGNGEITHCKTFANCQYHKIHWDIAEQSCTTERTCIDIGSCEGPLSSSADVPLVDWTGKTNDYQADRCVPVTFLVLHHTVTHSALETLHIMNNNGLSVQYIMEKNGTAFQMVHDYYRAWHAGASNWREYSDLNSWSVGMEIVNTGDEPFPSVQLDGIVNLSRMLIKRWHLDPHDIVGHFDIVPLNKNDPSGYFDWKTYYTKLGYYTDIWPTNLTPDQQKVVVMNPDSYEHPALMTLQEQLRKWGYQGSVTTTGFYDEDTKFVIQAFNRHWCPEVFIIEKVDYTTNATVIDPTNQQWYAISQERLDKLLLTL